MSMHRNAPVTSTTVLIIAALHISNAFSRLIRSPGVSLDQYGGYSPNSTKSRMYLIKLGPPSWEGSKETVCAKNNWTSSESSARDSRRLDTSFRRSTSALINVWRVVGSSTRRPDGVEKGGVNFVRTSTRGSRVVTGKIRDLSVKL